MRVGVLCSVCITLIGKEERLEQDDLDYQQINSPVKAIKMGEGEISLSSSAVWGSSGVEPSEKKMKGISSR